MSPVRGLWPVTSFSEVGRATKPPTPRAYPLISQNSSTPLGTLGVRYNKTEILGCFKD
jgi:hypothetical protein